MINAVFFDLDNTLCDSDAAWNTAVDETFQMFCLHEPKVSIEVLTKAWTKVHLKLFQQLDAGKCSMAEVRDVRFTALFKELNLTSCKMAEELNDFLSNQYVTSLCLYEDVTVLEELNEYHVGIITNGAHDEHKDSQLSKVRHLGLSDRIQSLTISDEIGVRKPKFDIFAVACKRANVQLKEAVLVGDSVQNDIVGANRAGMTSILIDRKSDVSITNIADQQPDYLITNLYDVLDCLEGKQHENCIV